MIQALSHCLGRAEMPRSPMDSSVLRPLPRVHIVFSCTSISFSPIADGQVTWLPKPSHLTLTAQLRQQMGWSYFLRSCLKLLGTGRGPPQSWSAVARRRCHVTRTRPLEKKPCALGPIPERGNFGDQTTFPLRVLRRQVTPEHQSHLK